MKVVGMPEGSVAVDEPGSDAREGRLARVKARLRAIAHAALDPVASGLTRVGVTANHLSVLGLSFSAAAGFAFFDGHSRLGAALLLGAGVCDILDGQVARRTSGETAFGAFFDSTLDRVSEALVLTGILGFCLRNLVALIFDSSRVVMETTAGLYPQTWAVVGVTAMLALTGSFLVSYTRARAEGLGLECKVGWFERPERLTLLIVAGALHVFWAMSFALLLLALFSFVTAAQRVAHVWKLTRTRDAAGRPAGPTGGAGLDA
ncbi:MAG: CDP-alcohol phosphatidyltransferase family protein [Candidatus Eisenbacteria bacterium]|nr:CDP-alcohol phosphatidyltransferase family protein [Candidatus Eisenbacteria bacterium]